MQKLLQLIKYAATMNAANYHMSPKHKLMLIMLVDGEQWRAHNRQAFHYSEGAWVMKEGLHIEVWEIFLALEGLLLVFAQACEDSEHVPSWSWGSIEDDIKALVSQHANNAIPFFGVQAKDQSDHLRQVTSNKAWKANWIRRMADALATFRCQWESSKVASLSKLFLMEWDSPMPPSKGVCFRDIYLDDDWSIAPKCPGNDCYLQLDYEFFAENLLKRMPGLDIESFQERLRLFLISLYYKNEHSFQVKLCFLHAAFKKVCTSKILFEIGKGGSGKGMEAYLEKALFSDPQSATLDCGVFLDRQEFRKSAEFAWNKANVRIQEMDQHARFISDLWKRFVVDEEVDCRVNYGFTSKRRFGSSMKVQELNYENIPIIEDGRDSVRGCDQLKRRVLCLRMGKATFVPDAAAVDHSQGIFKLIPQDELVPFLTHPLTASIYFREWCLPFFQENSIQECLQMILNPKSIHPDLERDTAWLASRLSGSAAPPPGAEVEERNEADDLIKLVHSNTPCKHIIKECLIQKVDGLPGAIASSRGRRTKVQNFEAAMKRSGLRLFREIEHHSFEKLLIDWQKLDLAMKSNGGYEVFGGWNDWGCPFDLRHLQQAWTGQSFSDLEREEIGQHLHRGGELAQQARPTIIQLQETVNMPSLRSYVDMGADRRLPLLQAYLCRHESEGQVQGQWSTIKVDYYTAPHYGRWLARGPSAQKLTKEARKELFAHNVEIDASCCHPRLLRRKLQQLDLWEIENYKMLEKFCSHFQAWRSALSAYCNISTEAAKKEIIRIFYGGNPRNDIPWLRKLGQEVQSASSAILSHHTMEQWSGLYTDRSNPEFSRLCALLSFEEALILEKLHKCLGPRLSVAIFDGGLINCNNLEDDILLSKACAQVSEEVVPIARVQADGRQRTFVWDLYHREVALPEECEKMCSTLGNCLLNCIASVAPECDIQELISFYEKNQEALTANDFNQMQMFSSQRQELPFQLHLCEPANLLSSNPRQAFLCHERTLCGSGGHWWSFCKEEDAKITIFDCLAGEHSFTLPLAAFQDEIAQVANLTFFVLRTQEPTDALPSSPAYHLPGSCGRQASEGPALECYDRVLGYM